MPSPREWRTTPLVIDVDGLQVSTSPVHLIPKPKLDPKQKINCQLCKTSQTLSKMRNHVGRHILLYMRGVEEENLAVEVCN
jgi:hypothetical protein